MKTNEITRPRRTARTWLAVSWAVPFSALGLVGWLWLIWAGDSTWQGVSLAALLTPVALVGIPWYMSRARAERRWRAALDRYAEQELAYPAPIARQGVAQPGAARARVLTKR
jgi:hypothetical protein